MRDEALSFDVRTCVLRAKAYSLEEHFLEGLSRSLLRLDLLVCRKSLQFASSIGCDAAHGARRRSVKRAAPTMARSGPQDRHDGHSGSPVEGAPSQGGCALPMYGFPFEWADDGSHAQGNGS